jgi:mono/diheme cytochrome c family protein
MNRSNRYPEKKLTSKLSVVSLLTVMVLCTSIWIMQDAIAHGWKAPKEAAEKQNPIKKSKRSIRLGMKLYTQFCADCHGKSLDGSGPIAGYLETKPPDLKQRAKHHPDGDFFWKIQYGRGDMPPFNEDLQEKEIWDIINYIKSLVK